MQIKENQKTSFRYLGSVIECYSKIDEKINEQPKKYNRNWYKE